MVRRLLLSFGMRATCEVTSWLVLFAGLAHLYTEPNPHPLVWVAMLALALTMFVPVLKR